MTTVKVDYYKSTGKWYTGYEFQTETPVYEGMKISFEIEEKYKHQMNYTFRAEDNGVVNQRMVVKYPYNN